MKARTPRRRSTRSDDQDATVCTTARTMKPSAIRLIATIDSRGLPPGALASHVQLTKLNTATAAHTSPCQARSLNDSSNSARVNSQNTTTLPVEIATSGAWPIEIGDVDAIE